MGNPCDRVPAWLRPLVESDKQVTASFLSTVKQFQKEYKVPDSTIHRILMTFELATHGIPWIIALAFLIWMSPIFGLQNMTVNLFVATIVDIVIVAAVKSFARRRRPSWPDKNSEMMMTYGPDKFSFPSGHASRAVLMALLMASPSAWFVLWNTFLGVWATSVCISRIILGRHFVGDVLGGAFLGFLQYLLMCKFWLSESTTLGVLQWFTSDPTVLEFE